MVPVVVAMSSLNKLNWSDQKANVIKFAANVIWRRSADFRRSRDSHSEGASGGHLTFGPVVPLVVVVGALR